MKLTKKQSILTGVGVAVVAVVASAAMLAPQDVKDRAIELIPGHTEEAPATEPKSVPAPAAEKEVDNGSPKATS